MKHIGNFIKTHFWEIMLVIGLLTISGVAHGYNMFNYPYYESDEGTYMAQAWAVAELGKLAPYTYWYDHAPAGWFLIAGWLKLTGGLFTFGFSLNSGRVLMLVLHVASTLLLYLVARKLTKSQMVGWLAGLMFSLSPLALYFQRRVLLDNIMIFWVFLSLFFVLYSKQKLRWIIASALSFGIAVLSKESAIFFLPFFVVLVFTWLQKSNRLFGVFQWLAVSVSVISLYFLYSFLKGELFPSGTLLGGTNEHVSLLGTLDFQANRGNVSILNPGSSFWEMAGNWKNDDPTFLMIGAATTIVTLLFAIKSKAARIIGGLAISYWAFLLRGGLVLEFYIIPLIPLVSLTTAYVAYATYRFLWKYIWPAPLKIFALLPILVNVSIIGIMLFDYSTHVRTGFNIYTANETKAQIDAVNWILSRKLPTQFYAIDNYAYLDLNLRNNGNFKNAEYYWKVDGDKDIKEKILHSDPNNIDYILFTPLIGGDLGTGEIPMIGTALSQSNPITSFAGDGWYVQIWAVKNSKRIFTSTWETYKKAFIRPEGNTIDPASNQTTSEGQSYAMLRAVWMNDQKQFDTSWNWTKNNLQQSNKLFAWKYGTKNGKQAVLDKNSATDADEDIALALAFAGKRWNNDHYLTASREIIEAIWANDIKTIGNKPYVVAGNWAKDKDVAIINPSYLSPASYRVFAEIDKKHPWNQVVDSSYVALTACSESKLDKDKSVGLPPDWCAINASGKVVPSPEEGLGSTAYSYDAFRTSWRIALDYQWFDDERAKKYLENQDFLQKEWNKQNKLVVGYTHDGKPWENYESAGAYAANLASLSVTDPKAAKTIYQEKVLKKLYEDAKESYWEDPKSYYTQNWAWFGSALYTNQLINLWNK